MSLFVILILFTMVVTELVDHMQIGSYLCDKAREIDKKSVMGQLIRRGKWRKGGDFKKREVTKEGAESAASDSTTFIFFYYFYFPVLDHSSLDKTEVILVHFDLTSENLLE
jgi:hypothetical protein